MGVQVDFNKVRDKLTQISKKMQKEVLDEALEEGAKPIIEAMKRNVPKDTLKLKYNLRVLKHLDVIRGTESKKTIGIDSEDRDIIERGYYQEYGHKNMIGKRWMKRSFREASKASNEAIIKSIKKNLKV